MLTDRSLNYNDTWKFLDNIWTTNLLINKKAQTLNIINSAVIELLYNSIHVLNSYSYSKISSILEEQLNKTNTK